MKIENPTTSSFFVKILLEYLQISLDEKQRLLQSVNLDLNKLEDNDSRIDEIATFQLLKTAEERMDDEYFYIHLGEYFAKKLEGHFILSLLRNCKIIENSLQQLIRYHNLITDIIEPEMESHEGIKKIHLSRKHIPEMISAIQSEISFSIITTVIRRLTEEKIPLKKVSFRHNLNKDIEEYKRIFSITPMFNSDEDCILIEERYLKIELTTRDNSFYSLLEHYGEIQQEKIFEKESIDKTIKNNIEKKILTGKDVSLKIISKEMNTGIRQLQNRLKTIDTTYQKIYDQARLQVALYYLNQEEIELCDIAFILGFADQSAFNNAFKKWQGFAPGEYRKRKNKV